MTATRAMISASLFDDADGGDVVTFNAVVTFGAIDGVGTGGSGVGAGVGGGVTTDDGDTKTWVEGY